MGAKSGMQDEISEVFQRLSLEGAEDRERFRLLADLGHVGKEPAGSTYERVDTRNNTAREDDYAQLEPTT